MSDEESLHVASPSARDSTPIGSAAGIIKIPNARNSFIGNLLEAHGSDNFLLGSKLEVKGSRNFIIGTNQEVQGNDNMFINGVDIKALIDRVQVLEKMVEHLWWMPGGAAEQDGKERFEKMVAALPAIFVKAKNKIDIKADDAQDESSEEVVSLDVDE